MLIGVAVLVGLGTWQMQRKAWKEGLIADIAVRTRADPVPLALVRRRLAAGEDVEYMRVQLRGRFLHDKEAFVYAPGPAGPGFNLYTPLLEDDGAIVLVNRGFVPESQKLFAQRPQSRPPGSVVVIGLVRLAHEKSWFTPDQGSATDVWYWRDLKGMAATLGAQADGVVPFFVDAEESPGPGWPRGGATRLDLPNRHLEYAITWYGLAVTLVGVYLAFAIRKVRDP